MVYFTGSLRARLNHTFMQRIILLVEDNEDDVFFMRRALQKAGVDLPLHIVMDGQQALDYLEGKAAYGDRNQFPIPHLMFLDLKLPYVHGFGVLTWLRSHTSLHNIPVVVLTSSPEERDRQKAHELGAKAYLVKPPTREMIQEAMQFAEGLR